MKLKRINKKTFLTTLTTLPLLSLGGVALSGVTSWNNDQSSFILSNHEASAVSNTDKKVLKKWDNNLEKYSKIDNDRTLFLGKNFLRLNNSVVFDTNQKKLVQKTTIGVYDELNNQLQAIELSNDYKQLYFIDDNDPSKGFVVSDDQNNAIYYPIDINAGLIDKNNAWSVKTAEAAINVAAYQTTLSDDDNNLLNKARIVSFSVVNNKLKVVVYNQNGSFEVENIPDINKAFKKVKVVKSFSINGALFAGLNFFDEDNHLIGSQIINIKNGFYINGGASFDINRQINAMVYDAEHNAIYVQYHFINENTTRMWYYSISPTDQFGQIGTIPNENYFSDLIYIKGEGIVGVNKQKSNLTLYPFQKDRILAAPTFKDVASSYTNDFFKINSDKVTNIIFDQKNQKFNVFYNDNIYTDGLVSFSLNDFKNKSDVYQSIVPVYVDEVKLIDEMNKASWQQSFASIYAKNNFNDDFKSFLVIPEFYKNLETQSKLAQDHNWNLSYQADENEGLINLKLKLKYEDRTLDLLDRNIFGFENVNVDDIKINYNKLSPLLNKTPTEIKHLLSEERTKEATKQAIFDLYGFDLKYKQLPFDVKIKDSSVLGDINFEFSFLTIKNNKITANFKQNDLVQKDALITANSTNNDGLLTFNNNFKLSVERWFIPVVLIAVILGILSIAAIIYFAIIQRKYPKLFANLKHKIIALNPSANYNSNNQDNYVVSDQLKQKIKKDLDYKPTKEIKLKAKPKNKPFDKLINNIKISRAKKDLEINKTKEILIEDKHTTSNTYKTTNKAATIDIFHQKMARDELSWNPEIKLTKQIA
ncbi:hypothetical protein [Mycoplasma sp. E35C]|uniref:hypothetical protein n=1 Tax=Mycoplasma sp. E35C TaxID=2801918 RepID=UPI001CA462C5|nr:hypothetical protein [Mycoplasma sp. E35C]QZX49480.1 hypothetical protein JJE79_01910 [Mycoplasma sp. E35C]